MSTEPAGGAVAPVEPERCFSLAAEGNLTDFLETLYRALPCNKPLGLRERLLAPSWHAAQSARQSRQQDLPPLRQRQRCLTMRLCAPGGSTWPVPWRHFCPVTRSLSPAQARGNIPAPACCWATGSSTQIASSQQADGEREAEKSRGRGHQDDASHAAVVRTKALSQQGHIAGTGQGGHQHHHLQS